MRNNNLAKSETTVSKLYQSDDEARSYIEKRFTCSWQKLLHDTQVRCVEAHLKKKRPKTILEIAPGPARIVPDLQDKSIKGCMVEYSREMIRVAEKRLEENSIYDNWSLVYGNAFDLSNIKSIPDKFEFIFSFRFLRHFKDSERFRLYAEIRSKLAESGYLMFDVVNRQVREKLESPKRRTSSKELPVFDISYTKNEFILEMSSHGFEVISMVPVLCHFQLQYWISIKLYDIFPSLHEKLIKGIDHIPWPRPLEWIALCRKI